MKNTLTKKQQEIIDFLVEHFAETSFPPTIREIAAGVGIKTPSTIHVHLNNLVEKGYIEREDGKARSIILSEKAYRDTNYVPKISDDEGPGSAGPLLDRFFGRTSEEDENSPSRGISIPLIGQVAAGSPILAEENIEEYLTIPANLASGDMFMLRVQGDSMVEAGIFARDLIIVKQQNTAENGDIVVAILNDDEATVKTFYREADRIKLQPENSNYEPIYTRDARIVGKAVGLLRTNF